MPFRATFTLVVTVVGLFLLFNFKTPAIVAPHPVAVLPTVATSPPPSPTPSAAGGSPNPPSQTASATQAPTPTPGGFNNGTFTGQDFPNQFGDVQVSVTIAGGRITDVQALQLPMAHQRSADISQQAGPLLHDEVLQAQSAQIDGVSGATYTSQSYAQSVQSALDQA